MKVIIKKGKNLSNDYIKKWNETRLKEFDEDRPLNLKNRKNFEKDIFFTLYDKNKNILSCGRLKQIKINFLSNHYNILGGADLVSTIRGKGYGKITKKAQIKYAKERKKTMIGFCTRKNTPFYEKCGLEIKKDLVKRFVYPSSSGYKPKQEEEKYKNRDVTYLNGKDEFMKKVLANPKEKVIIPIPHW